MGFFVAAFYVNYKEIQGKTAMNKETLQKILETRNMWKIYNELEKLGYRNAKSLKNLREASLVDIVHGEWEKTEGVELPKVCFCGTIIRNVKEFEDVEWIWLERLEAFKDSYIPKKTTIYAKKIVNNEPDN